VSGNKVVVTFAGDTKKLTSAFDRVGRSARKMSDDVGRETESIGKTASRAAVVAGAAIGATMAPALGAALAGGVVLAIGGGFLAAGIMGAARDPAVKTAFGEVGKAGQSALKSFSEPFKGPLIRAAATFAGMIKQMQPTLDSIGAALAPVIDKLAPALAQMATNALPGIADAAKQSAPAFEAIAAVLPKVGTWIGQVVTQMAEFAAWGVRNADTIGQIMSVLLPVAGVVLAVVAAIKVWIAVQTILNVVMALNPIGLIIIAVAALIAIIVIIATRTTWFQRLWKAAWGGIKSAASAVWDWLKKVPGWIGTAFAKVANFVTAPFRAGFSAIAGLWNRTIGSLSWAVPSWVPGIGGNTISVPKLPTFHSGGVVPGVIGTAVPIMAQAGERVSGIASRGGSPEVVYVRGDGLVDALIEAVAARVSRRGGAPSVLGLKV
jgi:hypothetical protein